MLLSIIVLTFILNLINVIEVQSIYKTFNFKSNIQWASTVVEKFAMAKNGIISIDYNVYVENSTLPFNSYVLILITGEIVSNGYFYNMPSESNIIYNTNANINYLCSKPSLYRNVIYGSGTINFQLNSPNVMYSDRYSIYILQCYDNIYTNSNIINNIVVNIETSLVNIRPNNNNINELQLNSIENYNNISHLPINYVFTTRMYIVLIIIHLLILFGLFGQLLVGSYYRNSIGFIHILFVFTEIFYIAYLFGIYSQYYYLSIYGFLTYSYNILPCLLKHFSNILFLLSMLFVSLGFGIIRDTLSQRETQLTTMAFIIYIINGFFTASCDAYIDSEYGEDKANSSICRSSYSMAYLVNTMIYLGAILGMNYSVTALRVQVAATVWSHSSPFAYVRAKQFQQFRYIYLLYLLAPLIITILDVFILILFLFLYYLI